MWMLTTWGRAPRSQPTYEGLKPEMGRQTVQGYLSSQPTYEGLKHGRVREGIPAHR